MLLASTVLPLAIINDICGHWPFGVVVCNIWLNTDVLYCTASVWSLVMIACDRYTATKFPIWYRSSSHIRRTKPYIIIVWSLSFIICIPQIIGWTGSTVKNTIVKFFDNLQYDNVSNVYQCQLFNEPYYVIYSAMGSFILPLIIMSSVYIRIFTIINQKKNLFSKSDTQTTDECNSDSQQTSHLLKSKFLSSVKHQTDIDDNSSDHECSYQTNTSELKAIASSMSKKKSSKGLRCISVEFLLPQTPMWELKLSPTYTETSTNKSTKPFSKLLSPQKSYRSNYKKRRRANSIVRAEKRETRATKIMLLIMIIFILCWIPFTFMYMIRALCNEVTCPVYRWLQITLTWFGYTNSSINPILYTILNREFRNSFQKLLKRR